MNILFPTFLYALGSILLVVLIILVIKTIYTIDKINEILDDVNDKVKSLNGLFNAINMTSSVLSSVGDKLIDGVLNIFNKFVKKNKKVKEEDLYE